MFIATFFIIAKIWEQIEMSFNREMDKQSMLYLYNKIFQRYREMSNKMMEKSKCNLPSEGSQSDKAT